MSEETDHHAVTADGLDEELAEAAHIGETVAILRRRAGIPQAELASRAGMSADLLRQLEEGIGLRRLGYDSWMSLIRATQPPRPEWWDQGHEHDLSLGPDGHAAPTSKEGRLYWGRVERVRAQLREHYRRGRR